MLLFSISTNRMAFPVFKSGSGTNSSMNGPPPTGSRHAKWTVPHRRAERFMAWPLGRATTFGSKAFRMGERPPHWIMLRSSRPKIERGPNACCGINLDTLGGRTRVHLLEGHHHIEKCPGNGSPRHSLWRNRHL